MSAQAQRMPNIILVGDADMLMDRNWVQKRNILGTEVAQAFANNGDFVINALEQMAGGPALTDLRGRGVSWRPFETIQKMEAEASKKYSAKEQELTKKLKDTEEKLTQLSRTGGDKKDAKTGKEVLSSEQLKAIERFKTELLAHARGIAQRAVCSAPGCGRPEVQAHGHQRRCGSAYCRRYRPFDRFAAAASVRFQKNGPAPPRNPQTPKPEVGS